MSIFSKNTRLNSEEYEKILKRLAEIEAAMKTLDLTLNNEISKNNSLRGLVNRKLSGNGEEEETEKDISEESHSFFKWH